MSPQQIMSRRSEALHSSTRSEILMSIGAALLLVGVTLLRFGPGRNAIEQVGCVLVILWVAITLYRMRGRLSRGAGRPDAAAATMDYYRRELESRRDHLRDGWLWHGPLLLACLILAGMWSSLRFGFYTPRDRVLPLLAVLVLWIGYGVRRRLRQASSLQREIDDLSSAGDGEPRPR